MRFSVLQNIDDADGGIGKTDMAVDRGTETMVMPKKTGFGKLIAFCFRLVPQVEQAEVEVSRLSFVKPRCEMSRDRTVGVSDLGQRRIEIAAGIADPIFAIDREFDGKLVVVGVRPAAVHSHRAAAYGKEHAVGTVNIQAEIRVGGDTEAIGQDPVRRKNFPMAEAAAFRQRIVRCGAG